MDPLNTSAKFDIRSFTHSWDNRGYFKKLGVPRFAHDPYFPNFKRVFVRMDPANIPAKSEVRSFSSDCNFGVGCEPQSWGREGRKGSWMAPFERALVTSYRLSIVTFPPSLRVSEILPLLFSSMPPLVSPKFPHRPMWSWSTNVTDRRTDRQTDRRTTCNLNTALCTSASCGKNVEDCGTKASQGTSVNR